MGIPGAIELRLGVLAVSVLHDVDVEPAPLGVTLPGVVSVWVSWGEVRLALAGHDPESDNGRTRLASWLTARRWCADVGDVELRDMLRPVGLPVDHLLHPGLAWVRERVLGDVLDLGLGAVGLDESDPDRVVPLPPQAIDAAGIDPAVVWLDSRDYLEDMGRLAASRLARDSKGQLRMAGDKYRGVKFEHDYKSGKKGTDKNGTDFKFSGEGFTHVPYYYTGAIPLMGVVPAPTGN